MKQTRLGLAAVALAAALSFSGVVSYAAEGPSRPKLIKLPFAFAKAMESTPVIFNSRPLLVANHRDDTKNHTDDYTLDIQLFSINILIFRIRRLQAIPLFMSEKLFQCRLTGI